MAKLGYFLGLRRFPSLGVSSSRKTQMPSPLLSMAALSVEHLKVMAALTVEPAYAFNLLIGWGGLDGGLISRAPKGDGGPLPFGRAINPYGRAPPDLMVEHLKVMAASRACLRILISRAP